MMDFKPVDDDEIDAAVDEVFAAVHRWRELLKRRRRADLAGVLVARSDFECILYSESEKYTSQIYRLLWDRDKDTFTFPQQEQGGGDDRERD